MTPGGSKSYEYKEGAVCPFCGKPTTAFNSRWCVWKDELKWRHSKCLPGKGKK